jgi:hypothetical protein
MTQAASSRRTATRRAASGAATPAAGGQLSYSFSQANPRSTSGSSRLSVFWVAAAARRGTWSRFVVKMLLPRRPLRVLFASNMALQRTRRPRLRSGRSLRSLGSPLNARPLGGRSSRQQLVFVSVPSRSTVLAIRASSGGECRPMEGSWLRVAASSSRSVRAASVAGNLRPT